MKQVDILIMYMEDSGNWPDKIEKKTGEHICWIMIDRTDPKMLNFCQKNDDNAWMVCVTTNWNDEYNSMCISDKCFSMSTASNIAWVLTV
jgi:hypothetical protein